MLKGEQAMSPASATCRANGSAPVQALNGRSIFDPARMAAGPKRAPGRYTTPLSNGAPMIATSALPTESNVGRRAKVVGPAKRGICMGSIGPMTTSSLLSPIDLSEHVLRHQPPELCSEMDRIDVDPLVVTVKHGEELAE